MNVSVQIDTTGSLLGARTWRQADSLLTDFLPFLARDKYINQSWGQPYNASHQTLQWSFLADLSSEM